MINVYMRLSAMRSHSTGLAGIDMDSIVQASLGSRAHLSLWQLDQLRTSRHELLYTAAASKILKHVATPISLPKFS
eukprot:6181483-Pleurochrysis_carterae.AAC.2